MYTMAGTTIHSALELRELRQVEPGLEGNIDLFVTASVVATLPVNPAEKNDELWWEQTPDGFQNVVDGHLAMVLSTDGRSLHVDYLQSTHGDLIAHLIVDHALARALSLHGRTVLHATCVVDRGRTYGFLGSTGMGKSTLAMSFVADGAMLVADDCLVIDATPGQPIMVLPTYSSARLLPDSLAAFPELLAKSSGMTVGKSRVLTRPISQPVALDALFVLRRDPSPAAQVCIDPVSRAAALWELARHSFSGAQQSCSGAPPMALLIAARPVAESVRVFSLLYPSSFDALCEVRQAIHFLRGGEL